ncbi:PfkB family carbohydrate kinase [Metallosphaera javensis (ex Sakai et al. 2022)]|uniref:PfkB family carbohydrate kinase n=1 Tax=Metallosphaera javensis (ex Sakai et al. 2022) TaxID=2775498 RepID=UPI00259103DD|nr:MAG: nucleoside kinase [Metallosphaera javensis (ex Sakai et al. 2022)]
MGKLNVDIIVKADRIPEPDHPFYTDTLNIFPGGAATNYALSVHRLGHGSKILAKIGRSPIVKSLMTQLAEEGVGLDYVEEVDAEPNLTVIFLREDGRISMIRKKTHSLIPTPEDVSKMRGMFDVIHFASVPPTSVIYDEGARLVSYDPGPYAAEYGGEKVDVIYTNEVEYGRLGSRIDAKLVVIKRGSRGAIVLGDGIECEANGLKVKVVDTTGAGDVFDAAFNVKYSQDETVEEALRFAITASALKVERLGGTASPTLEQVEERLKKNEVKVICR